MIVADGLAEIRNGARIYPDLNIQSFISRSGGSNSVALYPARKGVVFYLLPNGLMEFDSDGQRPQSRMLRSASETDLGAFLSLVPSHDGSLWIVAAKGVAKCSGSTRSHPSSQA